MGNKMLIDAAHPEETRVVVLRGNRIEEFDFEAASKRQLRGNIYLAKVTRVEPSLQAAFIEYGGNRHGFLAFAEIHPDYYQIPIADRQALLEEEAEAHDDEGEEEPRQSGGGRRSRRHRRSGGHSSAEKRAARPDDSLASEEVSASDEGGSPVQDGADADHLPLAQDDGASEVEGGEAPAHDLELDLQTGTEAAHDATEDAPTDAGGEDHVAPDVTAAEDEAAAPQEGDDAGPVDVHEVDHGHDEHGHEDVGHDEAGHEEDAVEQIGGDALEDVPRRSSRPRRNYKIQEVIKRRQVLLVQVVKEERGNKGAALTTYLSLAGRYSVLMPNTARGGGISRKITDAEDRKRLKAIAQELEVPDGMGIILRTAGAARGIAEVKRDFEYLMRMWETVRETTLKSSAPTLVYEEGSLIKRSIRDLFNKDVDEVVVAGEEAYREARDFMRLLMPSQTKNVIHYRDPQPIFAKAGAEAQLDAMFSNQVVLKSGGYLVINQTEALVAIDVNSGRSTREHNIEDTALRTNLEAADEVARQLRLRDLAGLIVVDFIDMEESRNDRAVERRIKDALKNDRARIQIGRISHFGLLEMSRQRMRTGVLEGSTVMCAHCAGSGTVRSISSIALHVLRMIEDTLIKSAAYNVIVRTRSEVALYILNQKRVNLLDLESRFGVAIAVVADPAMTGTIYHAIERGSEATPPHFLGFRTGGAPADIATEAEEAEADLIAAEEFEEEEVVEDTEDRPVQDQAARSGQRGPEGEGEGGRRRKRRRRRRGRDGQTGFAPNEDRTSDAGVDEASSGGEGTEDLGSEDLGGEDIAGENLGSEDLGSEELADIEAGFAPSDLDRMKQEPAGDLSAIEHPTGEDAAANEPPAAALTADEGPGPVVLEEPAKAEAEAPRRRRSRRAPRTAEAATSDAGAAEPVAAEVVEASAPARRPRRSRARVAEAVADADLPVPSAEADAATAAPSSGPEDRQPELPLTDAAPAVPASVEAAPDSEQDPDRPKRSGWWQRAKATFTTGT